MDPSKFTCPFCGTCKPEFHARLEDVVIGGEVQNKLWSFLCERAGKFVSRERIILHLWGDDPDGPPLSADNIVSVMIYRLREDIKYTSFCIENEYSMGFRVMPRKAPVYYINILDEGGRVRDLNSIEEDVIRAAVNLCPNKRNAAYRLRIGYSTLRNYFKNGFNNDRKVMYRSYVKEIISRKANGGNHAKAP